MAINNWKTEAGQGGKLGHSNMAHWDYTEAIKESSRSHRRIESKSIIRETNLKTGGFKFQLRLRVGFERVVYDLFLDALISALTKQQILINGCLEGEVITGEIDIASSNLNRHETLDILDSQLQKNSHLVKELSLSSIG